MSIEKNVGNVLNKCLKVFVVIFLITILFHSQNSFASPLSVGYWKLDETSGTSVADTSGGALTGTNYNATSSTDVPSAITFNNPRSLAFNTANTSYVDLPNTRLVGGGAAWTVCGWFKTTSTGIGTIYAEGNNSQSNSVVTLDINATVGHTRLFVRNNSGSAQVIVDSDVTINNGAWHLACGVKNSDGNYALYVDNNATTSSTSLGSTPTLNVRAIGTLKRTTNGNYFTGNIDDVRVYDRALSASELTDLYNGSEIDNAAPTQASAITSTVVAGVSTLNANGTATTSITVTIRNASSTPISGEAVYLSSNRSGNDTITPPSAITDVNGVAIFTVASSVAGQSAYTATVGSVTITQTAQVTYMGINTQTGVIYTSTLDNLSLKMDVAYDNSLTNAPVVIDLHGYSGPYSGTDIIQRLAKKGVFAIKTYKRGDGSSQGQQDDSGREIYDFYDAIEYVKANYGDYVDEDNINVIGYSGGGGNAYGLITKFPDYFRSANIFFGMSDYCYDPTYSWWYNGDSSYRTGMQTNIGGTPTTTPDKCYSRAHALGAKNNPYSHIQLFYDTAETTVPLSHGTQYISQNTAAGFSNTEMHISSNTSTTSELSDNFSTDLSDYLFVGNGTSKFTWNNAGYIDWVGDMTATFSSVYKKFTSLRNYSKADRISAGFDFSTSSVDANQTILFGFRNSADTVLKNAVSILVQGQTPYIRIDYNGIPLSINNRDLTSFTTTLSAGATYKFDLEINNSVVTATLKNAGGTAIETKTIDFNADKGFDGVDSFGIYNFHNGAELANASGTFDNLSIDAYARWIHGYPQEGAGTAEGNITAENYFVPDIVAGTWSQPALNTSGTMFIPGYVRTKKFQIFLGNGNDEAGNLTYDISGSGASISSPKVLAVEGLTGTSTIALKMYELTPNTSYSIKDTNITDGGDSTSQATSTSDGTLSFSSMLGSTHRYEIFTGNADASSPSISSIDSSPSETSVVVTWATDEVATSQIEYGLSSAYTASSTLDTNLTTLHSVTLSGLTSNTTYHYRIISADASDNIATSSDQTFTTSAGSSSGGSSGGGSSRSSSSGMGGTVAPATPVQVPIQETGSIITPATFARNLALQARGEDVRTLQQFLIAKGFLVAGNDTGYFGPLTYQALVQYQSAMGIYPTSGYFGPITRSVMITTANYMVEARPTAPALIEQEFTKDLKFGTSDAEVRFLQQYLNSNGFIISVAGAGSTGQETTYFGPATQDALIRFQQSKGITPAAGYFGPITRQYIVTR